MSRDFENLTGRPDWNAIEYYLSLLGEKIEEATDDDGNIKISLDEVTGNSVKVLEEVDSPDYNQDSLVDIRYAMDKDNQMPLYTEVSNPGKRDQFGAAIPSDGIEFNFYSITAASKPMIIDTTGYQSIVIQNGAGGAITPTTSNYGQSWLGMVGWAVTAPQTQATTAVASTITVFPLTGRYVRLVGPAAEVRAVVTLRNVPAQSISTIGTVSTVTTLTQFGGNNIVTAGVNGMLAVGGNIAAGTAPTANPVPMGGADEGRLITPSNTAANLTPKTRRLLVDERGRIIPTNIDLMYGGFSNYQGTGTANVRDVTSSEGQLQIDIMQQILVELRLLNHQIHEMANGTTTMLDDLEMIRNSFSRVNYNA